MRRGPGERVQQGHQETAWAVAEETEPARAAVPGIPRGLLGSAQGQLVQLLSWAPTEIPPS